MTVDDTTRSPAGAPPTTPSVRVPDLVGRSLAAAFDRALDAGLLAVSAGQVPRTAPVWCQTPGAGTHRDLGSTVVLRTEGLPSRASDPRPDRLPALSAELLELWITGEAPVDAYVEGDTHATTGWRCVDVVELLRRLSALPPSGFVLSADLRLAPDGHVLVRETVGGHGMWAEMLPPRESFAFARPVLGDGSPLGVAGLLAVRHRFAENRANARSRTRRHRKPITE